MESGQRVSLHGKVLGNQSKPVSLKAGKISETVFPRISPSKVPSLIYLPSTDVREKEDKEVLMLPQCGPSPVLPSNLVCRAVHFTLALEHEQ